MPGASPPESIGNGSAVFASARPSVLSAGVVAHNEEANLAHAVASLLGQRLPNGVEWGRLWMVVSGSTDRTLDVARRLASSDPRLGVVSEPERRGKASALREVFARAHGDALVLLNGDAVAAPDAVVELLRGIPSDAGPAGYAVMGRPVPREGGRGDRWARALESLWRLHDHHHELLAKRGGGSHLSDELMLLGLPLRFSLPAGVVNDGSYIGVWLTMHGGRLGYAPAARVEIATPQTFSDHLAQRRRIHCGNLEVAARLGAGPSTLARSVLADPAAFLEVTGRAARSTPARLVWLATLDALAWSLARWDRLPPSRSYASWRRVRTVSVERPPLAVPVLNVAAAQGEAERHRERIARLLRVAREFEVPASPDEFARLLPSGGPGDRASRARWASGFVQDVLRERPVPEDLDPTESRILPVRRQRGEEYLAEAHRLASGPLAGLRPWVRFLGVSGSAAYALPQEGDDLDLFVIVRRGLLWWVLAYALLLCRLDGWRRRNEVRPDPCLNRLLDERAAASEYRSPRGLLFAREALTVRTLWGSEYYRSLVGTATWMADELPHRWTEAAASGKAMVEERSPWSLRVLGALAYPWMAAYLQLGALWRNGRFRRTGRGDRSFRLETTPMRYALSSARFERLRSVYEGPLATETLAERNPEPEAPAHRTVLPLAASASDPPRSGTG